MDSEGALEWPSCGSCNALWVYTMYGAPPALCDGCKERVKSESAMGAIAADGGAGFYSLDLCGRPGVGDVPVAEPYDFVEQVWNGWTFLDSARPPAVAISSFEDAYATRIQGARHALTIRAILIHAHAQRTGVVGENVYCNGVDVGGAVDVDIEVAPAEVHDLVAGRLRI